MPLTIDSSLSRRLANVGFVCACMVVCLHVHVALPAGTVGHWAHRLIMSIADVAVPMFFVISGFLMAGHIGEEGWWKSAVKKRLVSLLVPYLIWNIGYMLLGMALTSVAGVCGGAFGGGHWSDLSLDRVGAALGINPLAPVELPFLWFVRCLIVFVAIAPLFAGARKSWGWIYPAIGLVISLLLPYWLPPAASWETHFHKYTWVKGFTFYSLGIYLRWNGARFSFLQSRKIGFAAFCLGTCLMVPKVAIFLGGGQYNQCYRVVVCDAGRVESDAVLPMAKGHDEFCLSNLSYTLGGLYLFRRDISCDGCEDLCRRFVRSLSRARADDDCGVHGRDSFAAVSFPTRFQCAVWGAINNDKNESRIAGVY